MKKAIVGLLVGIGAVCCASSEAFAWSEATHAYIADHVGKKSTLQNYNEVYGAMVPDAFNTNFQLLKDPQLAQCIRGYTHG